MNDVFVQYSCTSLTHWTLLKALKPISSHPHKTVHRHSVNFIQIYMLAVDPDRFDVYSVERRLSRVPLKSHSRQSWVPACQVGIHGHTVFKSFDDISARDLLDNDLVFNDLFNHSKGNGSWFYFTVHPEVAWVHEGAISWCEVTIKWDQKL